MNTLTIELKKWRFLNKLSQKEVCKKIGCSQSDFSRYETGDKKRIPVEAYLNLRELVTHTRFKINPEILTIDNITM